VLRRGDRRWIEGRLKFALKSPILGGGWLEGERVWLLLPGFFCWCGFVGRAVANVIEGGFVSYFCQVVGME